MRKSNAKDRKSKNNPSSSRTSDQEENSSGSDDKTTSSPPDFNSSLAPRGNKKKARTATENDMEEDFARPEHVLSPTAPLFVPPQATFNGAPTSPYFFTAPPPPGGTLDASNRDPSAVASRTRSNTANGNQSTSAHNPPNNLAVTQTQMGNTASTSAPVTPEVVPTPGSTAPLLNPDAMNTNDDT